MPQGRDRESFFPPEVIRRLTRIGKVQMNPFDRQLSSVELAASLEEVDILMTGWGTHALDFEVLRNAKRLKIVAHTGASIAQLVSPQLYERNITVLGGNEVIAADVAEAVLAYALFMLRELRKYNRQIEELGWSQENWYSESLFGKTVGLMGFGAVARHLVTLLKPFGTTILVHADFLAKEQEKKWGVTKVDEKTLFANADILSVHLSYTKETYRLINKDLLALLKPDALFINTARGAVVDEQALAELLQAKRFRAVIDVFETEPLPMDSPLRGLDNVLLIPHMAGPAFQSRARVTQALIDGIVHTVQGQTSPLVITQEAAQRMTRISL